MIWSFFAIGYGLLGGLRVALLKISNILSIKSLHRAMIKRVLHAPINDYFDREPLGRILNRFSGDINRI